MNNFTQSLSRILEHEALTPGQRRRLQVFTTDSVTLPELDQLQSVGCDFENFESLLLKPAGIVGLAFNDIRQQDEHVWIARDYCIIAKNDQDEVDTSALYSLGAEPLFGVGVERLSAYHDVIGFTLKELDGQVRSVHAVYDANEYEDNKFQFEVPTAYNEVLVASVSSI